eukprot:1953587-Rhodomonas_salina.2
METASKQRSGWADALVCVFSAVSFASSSSPSSTPSPSPSSLSPGRPTMGSPTSSTTLPSHPCWAR